MGLIKIASIIISSSVIATFLSIAFNFIIQNLNYKREYFKKIIDKRIEAQDFIINIINELKVMTHLDNGKICNIIFFSGEIRYNNFIVTLALTKNQSFWLSDELNDILLELNIFLLEEISYKIDKYIDSEKDAQLILLGTKNCDKIRDYRIKIEEQLLENFSNMEQINTFLKSKRKSDFRKEYKIRKKVFL